MRHYDKNVLSLKEQLQAYKSAGMELPSDEEVYSLLTKISYYRIRGYCYHMYDNRAKRFRNGTKLSDIMSIYQFDAQLSRLLFGMLSSIEVTLRARLIEALLYRKDSLVLSDPEVFEDKSLYWKNFGIISSDIARSNEVFIKHNFDYHQGNIPVWAAVEVMSFGTLSKTIKNLKTGEHSPYNILADFYKVKTANGNTAKPSKKMFTSWVQSCCVLRNMCAHNSRIYNRSITTAPELLSADRVKPHPKFSGLYQILLAMKYLRPSDSEWIAFMQNLELLFNEYKSVIELKRLNFPSDWENHLKFPLS